MSSRFLAAALAWAAAGCAVAPVASIAERDTEPAEADPADADPPGTEPGRADSSGADAPLDASVHSARPSPPVEVVVGAFAFDGNWYQDGSTHEHERVAVSARPTEGGLEVRIGRAKDYGNTDLTLLFERDDAGRTTVTPSARWFTPRRKQGRVESGELLDLHGCVQMQFEDWSPGNALNCRFALLGTDRSRTILLSGAFLVRNPPR